MNYTELLILCTVHERILALVCIFTGNLDEWTNLVDKKKIQAKLSTLKSDLRKESSFVYFVYI